jgi:peroxiredoxin
MATSFQQRVRPRSAILVAIAAALTLSVLYSASLQYQHAEVPIADSAEETRPLQVGELAPRFIVETVDHRPFVFDPDRLERPVLVISFRGGWCPHCNFHLAELREVIPAVDQLGIDVLFLSGDRPELLYRSLKAETNEAIDDLDYRILSDANAEAAIRFGIAFEASAETIERRHEKGDDIAGSSMLRRGILPVPSVFAIGRDGKVAFSFSNPDYRVRLPADKLLQVARSLVRT